MSFLFSFALFSLCMFYLKYHNYRILFRKVRKKGSEGKIGKYREILELYLYNNREEIFQIHFQLNLKSNVVYIVHINKSK